MRKISIDDIVVGTELKVDIFTDGNLYMPLLRKGNVLTKDLIEKLRGNAVSELYVDDEKKTATVLKSKGGQQNLWSFINTQHEKKDALLSPEAKNEAVALLRNLFNGISGNITPVMLTKLLDAMDELANRLVFLVCPDKNATININDLRSNVDFLYHHSLCVAVISIAIGHSMNLDYNSLVLLAKCAMLHDIGKNGIPSEILNKTDKLTEEEFEIVKGHSAIGYSLLSAKNVLGERERLAVACHHEKADGTGYPYGLTGEGIPLFSKIISIADIFDAMTSKRAHREPFSPAEAFEYIMSNTNIIFDFDVVNTFIKKIEVYPVGCFVELSTGNIAVVVDIVNVLRPVVRLLETDSVVDLYSNRRFLNVVIKRVIPPKEVYQVIGL